MSERRKWLTHIAPLVVWTIVILGLGTGLGSIDQTSRFIRPLLEFLFPAATPATISLYHGYIRKFAHFAEYAMLAFFAYRAFRPFRVRYIAAFSFVIVIAAADEFDQSFSHARTASAYDVILDIFGGVVMLLVIRFFDRGKGV